MSSEMAQKLHDLGFDWTAYSPERAEKILGSLGREGRIAALRRGEIPEW